MAPGGKTLTPLPEEKALSAYLKRLGHVAIAFSGGCDSTLLTAFAIRELGAEHVLPVHVSIPMTIEQETREALRFAEHLGARCLNLKLDVLQLPEIVRNDKWRCYHCKKYLFTEILRAAAENGFRNCAFETANLFDWFGENRERRFDLIVLDPPPFARTKDALAGALRGYKELNLRALKMLNPGGVLATYSCSQRVGTEKFIDVLSSAAHDARRRVTLLEITGQPEDHPALLNFPESRYLKGLILRAD